MKLRLKQNFRGRRSGEEFNWPDELARSLIEKNIAEPAKAVLSKKKSDNTERAVKNNHKTR